MARDIADRMEVVGLAAGRNADLLIEQAREFQPSLISIHDPADAEKVRAHVPAGTRVVSGLEGLVELATMPEADMVLISIVGTAGLKPALAAIEAGKDIAVASKEILVMAGEEVMEQARKKGIKVLPVDSEHNAVFQCLEGQNPEHVRRVLLTASGGPFRQTPVSEFPNLTKAQALKHPTWEMGRKITIDSSTLFNKGLEMIEAKWLFGIPMSKVEVVVHPQSVVHSMVEFVDHSILAQLSKTDMCFPIQYAVTYPDRLPNRLEPVDFAKLGTLTFEAPDPVKFPALRLAREAGEKCGTLPAVLNAANEIAVDLFLNDRVRFPSIWGIVEETMLAHTNTTTPTLDCILDADTWARAKAAEFAKAHLIS